MVHLFIEMDSGTHPIVTRSSRRKDSSPLVNSIPKQPKQNLHVSNKAIDLRDFSPLSRSTVIARLWNCLYRNQVSVKPRSFVLSWCSLFPTNLRNKIQFAINAHAAAATRNLSRLLAAFRSSCAQSPQVFAFVKSQSRFVPDRRPRDACQRLLRILQKHRR